MDGEAAEEEVKIAHSMQEVEKLLKQGYDVGLFVEKKEGLWLMRKPECYEPSEEEEEEREEWHIADVKEVPPEEVKGLVEQGYEVRTIYKGAVTMVLRKREGEPSVRNCVKCDKEIDESNEPHYATLHYPQGFAGKSTEYLVLCPECGKRALERVKGEA